VRNDAYWDGLSEISSVKQSLDSLFVLLQGVKPELREQDPPQQAPGCKDTHKNDESCLEELAVGNVEALSSWMPISLSRWIFLLLVAHPIFPLACKALISVKISSNYSLR